MQYIHSSAIRALLISATLICANAAAAPRSPCSELLNLEVPDLAVETAELIATPVRHCKITARIGGRIGLSVWLPETWNGRFTMGGSGGFVQPEDNQALRLGVGVLEAGFATASTDTGHQADGMDGSWALNDLEAIVNYGHLGTHRAVLGAKSIIEAHYGRSIEKSFFLGCSNGGRQALHEVQRYPDDFDAVIAGAPAANFIGVAAQFVAITKQMFPDPQRLDAALVTAEDRRLLRGAILDACDAQDGLEDGVLQDPTACEFDPERIACDALSDSGRPCLSTAAITAINTVYQPVVDNSGALHVGFPFGAEDIDNNGWGSWLTGGHGASPAGAPNAAYRFGVGMMRYFVFHDPDWNYTTYDFNDYRDDTRPLAATLNATNPDLSAFRARGGKLLMFHGWADVALSAHMSIDYVQQVLALDSSARDDVRLFMMPGVLHCAGGPGPSVVNWLEALERWHDSGDAPETLTAAYPDRPGQRRLCAWPRQAHYLGGDAETIEAYECR